MGSQMSLNGSQAQLNAGASMLLSATQTPRKQDGLNGSLGQDLAGLKKSNKVSPVHKTDAAHENPTINIEVEYLRLSFTECAQAVSAVCCCYLLCNECWK